MACPPERYASLPVAPEYKESLVAFCSDPNNAEACNRLCQASDEEIVATIEKIGPQLEQWKKDGLPEEIRSANPELSNEFPQTQNVSEGLMDQGIGALPPKVNPAIPPGQLADVPMPMDVPSSPPASNVSYRTGGSVEIPRYGLGGLVGGITDMFGGNGGAIGAIVGGALAFYTGGMSVAAGAAMGGAAGAYADTGDLGMAAKAGTMGYGAGTMGTGMAAGTAPTVGQSVNAASKVAGIMSKQPQAEQPVGILANNTPPRGLGIPGTNDRPIESNSKLSQGLGSLPALGSVNAESMPSTNLPNLEQQSPLSSMDEYYQCVLQNGAENCQMPESMSNQLQPLNLQPAQYPNVPSFKGGGNVDAPGTETSDSQLSWLSDNEFVMTANAVRGLGNGNVDIGANRMYDLMTELEQRGRQHGQ